MEEDDQQIYADVVRDYVDSGAGPIDGPYGFDGDAASFTADPVDVDVVLGDNDFFLSLPTGSFVTVAFNGATVRDGPGFDIFIEEAGPGGESADIFVRSATGDFVLLGTADNADNTSRLDLASIGFTEPVAEIRIVGNDSAGSIPGFDLVSVQALSGAFNRAPVAVDDTAVTQRDTGIRIEVLDNDTDPEGDDFEIVRFSAAENGAVATGDGERFFLYEPATGFTGTDRFSYTIRDDAGGESTAVVTITVGDGGDGPDYAVTEAELDSTDWQAGQRIPFSTTVENLGNRNGGNFDFYVLLSPDLDFDPDEDLVFVSRESASLLTRQSFGNSGNIDVDSVLSQVGPGTYYFAVFADLFNDVAELDESNNLVTELVTVGDGGGGGGGGDVNLRISGFGPESQDWAAGERVVIEGVVFNDGPDPVEDRYSVDVVLGDSPAVAPDDLLLASFSPSVPLDVLDPSPFTLGLSLENVLPDDLPSGAYYLAAFVDADGAVGESNEDDNRSSVVQVLYNAGNNEEPDLLIDDLSASRTIFGAGEEIEFTARVRNDGSLSVAPGYRVDYVLSVDATIDASDRVIATATGDMPILSGGTETVGQTLSVDAGGLAGVAPGSYFLGAIVDPGDAVRESDEGNNTFGAVPVRVPDAPDLVAENLRFDQDRWSTGAEITGSVEIVNRGAGRVEEDFQLILQIAKDTAPGRVPVPVALETVSRSIGPGERITVDLRFTVDEIVAVAVDPGSRPVSLLVDAGNAVVEAREGNNLSDPVDVQVPARIHLDFDNQIPVDVVARRGLDGSTFYSVTPGTEPLAAFVSDEQERALADDLQAIFDRSDLAVDVTLDQPLGGPFTSVRFAPPSAAPGLLGIAYQGLDTFNAQGNNVVAVYLNGLAALDDEDRALFVETVAHEAAHSWGLRHINPVSGDSTEVMDYPKSPAPQFYDQPAFILEPPWDDGDRDLGARHNPSYHIRRYVLDESDADLRADGVEPGFYDTTGLDLLDLGLSIRALERPLASLGLLLDHAGRPAEEGANPGLFVPLAEDIGSGDTDLTFRLPEGEHFAIVGSTVDPDVIDVVFDFGSTDLVPETTAEEGLVLSGDLEAFGPDGVTPIASAALEQTAVTTRDPDGPAPVRGTEGDDVLPVGFGDDLVEGLGGTDTVVYDLPRSGIAETLLAEGEASIRVLDGPDSGDVDRLTGVERVALTDGTYLYDLVSDALPFSYRLYSAAYARTPDEDGLRFWTGAREAGLGDRAMAGEFAVAPEFELRFGTDPSDEDFITALYLNVLLRQPDDEGERFWLESFATGELTRADMLLEFSESDENVRRNADNYDDGVWVL